MVTDIQVIGELQNERTKILARVEKLEKDLVREKLKLSKIDRTLKIWEVDTKGSKEVKFRSSKKIVESVGIYIPMLIKLANKYLQNNNITKIVDFRFTTVHLKDMIKEENRNWTSSTLKNYSQSLASYLVESEYAVVVSVEGRRKKYKINWAKIAKDAEIDKDIEKLNKEDISMFIHDGILTTSKDR